MLGKKRMIENFEIIHSIQIGARELVVGVSPELEFMCCFCTQDDIAEYYSEAMSSSEYLEIMELVIETAHILSFGLFLCPQAFEKVSVDTGCKRKLTKNSFMQTG